MTLPTDSTPATDKPVLSVVIPCYNEEVCLEGVLEEVREALDSATDRVPSWECLIVDDGSKDRSAAIAARFRSADKRFRLLRFEKNAGQTAAFEAGFLAARGEFIGMMDGDGQNDPHDFPRLLAELQRRKVDMMCGIRQKRRDTFVRRISSKIANGVRNWATKESVTDVGCSIRVFRRRCFKRIKLFNGLHRFFPTLFRIEGYKIDEIPVNHRPRQAGKSKYGINNRLWKAMRDLIAVRWMMSRVLRYRVLPEE